MNKIYSGALILGISNVVVKILGLFIIIPFARMVGSEGVALYTYAYVPFIFFMDMSTIGVVPGISRLTSKLNSENQEEKSRYLLVKSRRVMLIIGFISFSLLHLLAPVLASIILGGNEELINTHKDVTMAIRCISPSLIIGPVVSLYRGYIQGNLNMMPSAISLIIEQIVRFTIILTGAYLVIKVYKEEYVLAVNIAVISASVALFFAFIYLSISSFKYTKGEKLEFNYLKSLLKVCLPFGITTIFLTIYQLIDSLTFNRYLLKYSIENVEIYYGLYSFEAMRLIIIPILLAQSLATSLMPNITKLSNDIEKRNKEIVYSLNIVIIFCLITVFLFRYFSKEIYTLFYNNNINGPFVLATTSLLIFFFGINKVLLAIIQGINKIKYIVYMTIISFLLKYLFNALLIPKIGYNGAIYSSMLSISIVIISSLIILHLSNIYSFSKLIRFTFVNIVLIIISLLVLISLRAIINIKMNDTKSLIFGLLSYSILFISFFYLLKKIIRVIIN